MREEKRVLDLRAKRRAMIEEEHKRRERMFERKSMSTIRDQQVGLILAFIILALIGILFACTGCQTCGGLCRDIESAARYGHTHIMVEK